MIRLAYIAGAAAVVAVTALWMIVYAYAELPPGAVKGPNSEWFENLRHPTSGGSCCSIADCRPVRTRMIDGKYQVKDGEVWLDVPENSIVRVTQNPVGEAVACVRYGVVMCFVRGPET